MVLNKKFSYKSPFTNFLFVNYVLITLACSLLSSCQSVINVDLGTVSPKLVVEGEVNNIPGPDTIKLSLTANYNTPNTFQAVTGGTVIISDNLGNIDTMREAIPGNYINTNINGVSGRTYTLFISAQGQKYAATQNMVDTVPIVGFTYDTVPKSLFGPKTSNSQTEGPQYRVTLSFADPSSLGNYYGFRLYQNNILTKNIVNNSVLSDQLFNGKTFSVSSRGVNLMQYDTVRIELISFNQSTYNYYNTLQQALSAGSPFSAPANNPITDLSNGALGFLGAFAITSRTLVIQ